VNGDQKTPLRVASLITCRNNGSEEIEQRIIVRVTDQSDSLVERTQTLAVGVTPPSTTPTPNPSPTPFAITANVSSTSCLLNGSVSLSWTVSGGVAPYTVTSDDIDNLGNSPETISCAAPLGAQSFTFNVSDSATTPNQASATLMLNVQASVTGQVAAPFGRPPRVRNWNSAFGRAGRRNRLRLTYTAHDMQPFARDLGYDGPPFRWDAAERRQLQARLDALCFHLYNLDQFPVLARNERKQYNAYISKQLALVH